MHRIQGLDFRTPPPYDPQTSELSACPTLPSLAAGHSSTSNPVIKSTIGTGVVSTGDESSTTFPISEATAIIQEETEKVLKDTAYLHNNVSGWNANVVERSLKALVALRRPYKYIGKTAHACKAGDKNDVGLHTSTSCYWDSGADGCAIYRYDNDTLHAIVTVYGLSV
ncbi:MAG: Tctex-1 family-domain-containing protein [Piptocephalis tieghemiana]|nr:MAG: Tctex-1 family-domain-containing protein [Piptocephalis tieghemiana]